MGKASTVLDQVIQFMRSAGYAVSVISEGSAENTATARLSVLGKALEITVDLEAQKVFLERGENLQTDVRIGIQLCLRVLRPVSFVDSCFDEVCFLPFRAERLTTSPQAFIVSP